MNRKDIDSLVNNIPAPKIEFQNKGLLKQSAPIINRKRVIWLSSSVAAAVALIIILVSNTLNINNQKTPQGEVFAEAEKTKEIEEIITEPQNTAADDPIKPIEVEEPKIESKSKSKSENSTTKPTKKETETKNSTSRVSKKSSKEITTATEPIAEQRTLIASSGVIDQPKVIVMEHQVISNISTNYPTSTIASTKEEIVMKNVNLLESNLQKQRAIKEEIRDMNDKFWGSLENKLNKVKSLLKRDPKERKPLILIARSK